jgi:hypothetical protein
VTVADRSPSNIQRPFCPGCQFKLGPDFQQIVLDFRYKSIFRNQADG